jgi:hypothetical protein
MSLSYERASDDAGASRLLILLLEKPLTEPPTEPLRFLTPTAVLFAKLLLLNLLLNLLLVGVE